MHTSEVFPANHQQYTNESAECYTAPFDEAAVINARTVQSERSENQYPYRGNHSKADDIFVGVNNVQEYALVDLSANIIGCGKNNCQHNRVGRHQD